MRVRVRERVRRQKDDDEMYADFNGNGVRDLLVIVVVAIVSPDGPLILAAKEPPLHTLNIAELNIIVNNTTFETDKDGSGIDMTLCINLPSCI